MSPYREPAPSLACPRCGRPLSDSTGAVATCPGCHGVWLPTSVIAQLFDEEDWPQGTPMWWHSKLACPQCARTASEDPPVMLARNVGGVFIDRCARHGVWLDAGEVGRVVALPGVHDAEVLGVLRVRLHGTEGLPPSAPEPASGTRLALEREVATLQAELVARRRELAELERSLESKRAALAALRAVE